MFEQQNKGPYWCQFLAGVLDHINLLTFLLIVDATELDQALALLEFDIIGELYWSLLTGENPWILYDWDNGRVFPLKPFFGQAKRIRGPDGLYIDPVGDYSSVTAVPCLKNV